MKKFFKLLVASVSLALAGTLGMAVIPATAEPAEAITFNGTRVHLNGGSTGNVSVYGTVRLRATNGQYYTRKATRWLAPGQNSWNNGSMIHADSFKAPLRCVTYKVTGIFTKKYTVMRAGYTHQISGLARTTTLLIYC